MSHTICPSSCPSRRVCLPHSAILTLLLLYTRRSRHARACQRSRMHSFRSEQKLSQIRINNYVRENKSTRLKIRAGGLR